MLSFAAATSDLRRGDAFAWGAGPRRVQQSHYA